jgi:hypothetical protein
VTETPELATVLIIGLPLDLHARAAEHGEELRREFTLIAAQLQHEGSASVPRRLVELIDTLRGRYAGFSTDQEDALEAAIAAGRSSIDLTFRVPADVGEAAVALGAMLDDADEYCREGKHLLTLATPPDLVAYRQWYLGQFIEQSRGGPPAPWTPARPVG